MGLWVVTPKEVQKGMHPFGAWAGDGGGSEKKGATNGASG